MSDYRRTTRLCTLDELRPELAAAVRAYAQQQRWGNWEAEALACCETMTERTSTNRLDAWLNSSTPAVTYLALITTTDRLIWAYSRDGANTGVAGVGAASAQYTDMRLKIFRPKHTPDFTVDIYARMDGTREKTGGRFMLGSNPDAQKFSEAVMRATDHLYPPEVEKPRFKWFRKWFR